MEKYIGLMSGTSLDGVDSVLIETDGQQVTLLANDFLPMPAGLKQAVLDICHGQSTTLVAIGQLDQRLGTFFANAVQQLLAKSGVEAAQIRAIGSHGQTVFMILKVRILSPYNWAMPISSRRVPEFAPWPIFAVKMWHSVGKARR